MMSVLRPAPVLSFRPIARPVVDRSQQLAALAVTREAPAPVVGSPAADVPDPIARPTFAGSFTVEQGRRYAIGLALPSAVSLVLPLLQPGPIDLEELSALLPAEQAGALSGWTAATLYEWSGAPQPLKLSGPPTSHVITATRSGATRTETIEAFQGIVTYVQPLVGGAGTPTAPGSGGGAPGTAPKKPGESWLDHPVAKPALVLGGLAVLAGVLYLAASDDDDGRRRR